MPACVSEPSRQQVQTYFNSITRRYDILNAVLSLGLDRSWRTKAVKALLTERTRRVLDVGTGTGSLVAEMLRQNPELEVAAIDVARDMLALAQEKIKNPRVAWQEASALELPFNEESFEGVITAFTLCSIQNLPPFFNQAHKVLKPGGKIVLLELTRPKNTFLAFFHSLYVRFFVPVVGRLFSPSQTAYQFLAQSVLHFQSPQSIAQTLKASGFQSVWTRSLSGGIVTLIGGEK